MKGGFWWLNPTCNKRNNDRFMSFDWNAYDIEDYANYIRDARLVYTYPPASSAREGTFHIDNNNDHIKQRKSLDQSVARRQIDLRTNQWKATKPLEQRKRHNGTPPLPPDRSRSLLVIRVTIIPKLTVQTNPLVDTFAGPKSGGGGAGVVERKAFLRNTL